MNIFALPKEIISEMDSRFKIFKEKYKGDRKIEFLLPQELSDMIEKKQLKMTVYPAEEKSIGLTYPEDEAIIRKLLAR